MPSNSSNDSNNSNEQALFGAGCFWGVQYYFDQVPGIIETTVGYSGGHTANPTYEEVCTHTTGHAEVIKIVFDPQQVSYQTLVRHFFRLHDPTQLNRQGPDIGDSYRSAAYYYSDQQKTVIERIRQEVQATLDKPIVTEVAAAGPFYAAEDYHQKFAERTGRGQCHIPYEPLGSRQSL